MLPTRNAKTEIELKKKKIQNFVAWHSHFPRVGDIEEVRGVRLQLDEGGLGQRRAPHQHDFVLQDTQVRHQLKRKQRPKKRQVLWFMATEFINHEQGIVFGRTLFVITQLGMWMNPSSALNSSTPQCVTRSVLGFLIWNSCGYAMLRFSSRSRADVGMITANQDATTEG